MRCNKSLWLLVIVHFIVYFSAVYIPNLLSLNHPIK